MLLGGRGSGKTFAHWITQMARDKGTIIVATGPGGATARLTGEEMAATNGVAQSIDGCLWHRQPDTRAESVKRARRAIAAPFLLAQTFQGDRKE